MFSRRGFLATAVQASDGGLFEDAQAYERFMGRWSRLVAGPFLDFVRIEKGAGVLDVGSGTGALAAAIAARIRGCSVIGIDPSKAYVAYANSRLKDSHVRFETGDAQSLRYANASFDAAVSLLVFNFIPNPSKALVELRRVVRTEGVIGAAVWDYSEAMQMLRIFWDAAVALDPAAERLDEKHMPLCRKGELRDLWKGGGLAAVLEKGIEVPARFRTFDDFWEPFLLGQGPAGAYVKSLPAGNCSALKEELHRRLPKAPFTLRARVWAVRGLAPR